MNSLIKRKEDSHTERFSGAPPHRMLQKGLLKNFSMSMAFLLSIYLLFKVVKLQCEMHSAFFQEGSFQSSAQGAQPDANRYCSYTQVSTLAWYPLPAPVFSPPKPKELSFGAQQLLCTCLTKGFPLLCVTNIGQRPFTHDICLNQPFPEQRNLKISSMFYSMTASNWF